MVGQNTIYSDCSGVVDGIRKGEHWGMRPGRYHGGIWRQVWQILHEDHSVQVIKVKSHKSEAACKGDPMQLWLRKGDVAADGYAKAGSRRHPVTVLDLQRQRAHVQTVREVLWSWNIR